MVSKLQHTLSAFKSTSWLIDFSAVKSPQHLLKSLKSIAGTISVALTACLPL